MNPNPGNFEKTIQFAKYFNTKYGEKNAKFIISKIGLVVNDYSLMELIELGEKIALFNGWTKDGDMIDKLMEFNNGK